MNVLTSLLEVSTDLTSALPAAVPDSPAVQPPGTGKIGMALGGVIVISAGAALVGA